MADGGGIWTDIALSVVDLSAIAGGFAAMGVAWAFRRIKSTDVVSANPFRFRKADMKQRVGWCVEHFSRGMSIIILGFVVIGFVYRPLFDYATDQNTAFVVVNISFAVIYILSEIWEGA